MSDRVDSSIGPVPPVGGARPVRPVQPNAVRATLSRRADVGAITGGSLPAAYARLEVNPDTHDVVISVRDAATDQVISEYPSREVEAMAASMTRYAAVLARRCASKAS